MKLSPLSLRLKCLNPFWLARGSVPLALRMLAAGSLLGLLSSPSSQAATLYWKTSTAGAWTGSTWGAAAGGPYTTAYTTGSDVVFEANGGTTLTITGGTTNFASITANENVTVTAGGTLGTNGTVATITVATGKTLDFGSQAISTAVGTGFIKAGAGTLTLAGGTYAGGFTLNAGTVAVGGVNAMGAGGALTINGGTIRSNSTTARDLTGKYTGGITIGGNFSLGDATNTGALTFTDNMNLGASTRSITVDSVASFGGVISGAASVGLTKLGASTLTLSGANTYTGKTTVSAGTLSFNTIANVSGGSSALGAPTTVANGTIDLGGNLTYTGAATTSDRVINLTTGAATNTITNSGSALLTLTGGFTGNSTSLFFRGTQPITISGLIPSSFTGTVSRTDVAVLTLSNSSNAFSGNLVISNGTISANSIANSGLVSAIGAGSQITLGQSGFNNTGTLQFTGVSGGSSNRAIDIQSNTANTNGGIIENTVAGQTLTLSGNVTTGGLGTTPSLQLIGAGNGVMSGIIGGTGLSLTKGGTGTWTLSNTANTYNGTTTISAGVLRITSNTGLGTVAAGTSIVANSALEIDGTAGAVTVGAEALSINGGGITNFGALRNIAGNNIYGGTITMGSQSRVNSDSGTLTLNNATASVTGAFTLVVGGAGDVAISTPMTNGTGGVSKDGTGTLTLSGVNTYTGATTVTAGILRATTSVQALGTGAATLSLGGGTLQLANDTALNFARATTVTATSTITPDRLTSVVDTSVTHTLGTLSIGAQTLNITRGTNITGTGVGGITFGVTTLTGAATFAPAANTTLTLGAVSGATFGITKAGTGTLSLGGVIGTTTGGLAVNGGTLIVGNAANTFTGAVTVDGATSVLQMTSGSNGTATAGPLGIASTTTYKTVTLTNGGTFRPSATFNDNAPIVSAAGSYVFSIGSGGGAFDVPTGVTLTLDDGSGAGTASTNAQLQGSGTLTKTGVGTLSLGNGTSNFAAFTGAIIVNAGTLTTGSVSTTPLGTTTAGTTINTGAALNANGVVWTAAEPLTVNGTGLASSPQGALTNNSATAATWVGPITLGSAATIGHNSTGGFTLSTGATINTAGFALTMANNGTGNYSVNSLISGSGSVTVSGGTGQYVPNAQSTYTGGTTFSAGTSTIPQQNSTGNPGSVTSGPFGTGTLTFVPSAQIRARVSTVTTLNNNVTLNGGVTFPTAASEANIIFGGPVTLSGGNATITSTVGTTVAGTSAILSGAIGDGGNNLALIKAGTGNLTLGGANTYTGGTTVNAGALVLTGSLAANTGLTVAAGSVFSMGSGTANPLTTVSNLNLGAGTGTATLAFDLGTDTASSDRLITSAPATTINTVGLTLIPLTTIGSSTTYDLISAASGLSGAAYVLNSGAGGYTYSLSAPSDTLVQVTVAPITGTGSLYWGGSINNSWSALGASGATTNWTTDAAGTTIAGYNPTVGNTVIFSAANALGSVFSTTLDNNYTINDLQFTASPSGVTAVNIAAGPLNPGSLTLAPTSSSTGINVASNAGTVTISAPVVLGAAQTWSADGTGANGSSLTVSGAVTGTNALTIGGGGTGVVTLSAAAGQNTYSGSTTVQSGGILQGGATNSFSANSAMTVSGTGILRLNGFSNAVASLSGDGTIQNNHASTGATLTFGDATNKTFSGIVQNGGGGALGLTKNGSGSLTLSGANTHTGNTLITNGILNITGTGSLIGATASTKLNINPTAGNNAVVNYTTSGTSTLFAITGATVAGTASAFNQTAGTINLTPGNTTGTQGVVNATGAYGFYNITGGTLKDSNRFTLTNKGTAAATSGPNAGVTNTGVQVGVVYVGGTGTIDQTSAEWYLSYSLGQTTVADSGKIDRTGSVTTTPYGLIMDTTVVGGSYGVLNLAGSGAQVLLGAGGLKYGNSATANNGDGNSGFVNLAAGTLSTGVTAAVALPPTPSATNYGYWNYAGGTFKATGALSTGWTPAATNINFIHTLYGAVDNSAVTGAPSFGGGLTVDTNGNPVTITTSQPLLGGSGVGVAQTNLSISGGSGYIGAPSVVFSKPAAATGVPASGYALMTGGSLTGIVITSPGVYAANETPTITLLGGFSTGTGTAATVTSSALTTNNTSGGLTKIGLGTLTLSGAGNTYSAGTTVSGGTLALGINGGLPTNGNLTIDNTGTFDAATFTNSVGTVSLQGSGILTGSTGVLTSNADYDLRSGTVNFTGAGGLAGAVNVTKSTAGTVTLTNNGLGSFANVVNISGGTLAFSAGNQLGNASATNTLGINGGTLSYTAASATSLAANQVLTLGSSGGTLNASDASGVLNLLGGVTTATAANLTKTGLGAIAITGTTNLNGGNVTVSGGTLNAGFSATGLGSISIAAAATLNLYDNATTTMAINGLTLAAGSSLGFDLNAPTVNDVLNLTGTANVSPSVSLNFNSLGGLAAGTYDLLNVTAGSLAAGDYTLGSAPSGFNYVFSTINADQTLRLTTTPLNLVYWHGDIAGGSWSALNAGPDTNFSNVVSGATDLGALPVASDTLVFSTTTATGPAIATTLDGNFTVDSLRFTSNPSGVTAVSIDQGTSGTLTIAPVGSNNGISVAANAGTISIGAPVTTGMPQTWETANGTALNIGGVVTYTSGVTKTGNGVLTLSGNNTGTGGLNLAGGTLNLANNSALGTGTFTIGAGTTINASGGAVVNAGNNVQNWNGSFTFTGANALDLGTGAVTLNNSATVTATASTLTVGGAIGDGGNNRSLTKTGAGTLTLSGVNTYAGGTTLNAGTLNLGNAAALGSGTLTIAGGNLDNSSGSALTLSTNNAQAWNSNVAFTGTNALNLGTGAVVLSTTPTVTVTANTLTVGGNISGAGFGVTKAGAGTLILAGTNSYTGATTVNAGILRLSGPAGSTALTVNGGSLQFGSATALTSANNITLAATGTLDLFGNSQTIGLLTSVAGTFITNTGSGTGASSATTAGTPSGTGVYVDALNISSAASNLPLASTTDGATRKTQIIINNSNSGTAFAGLTAATVNSYSGGVVLANNAGGTRLSINAAITGTPFGSGPIIIGQTATDKAGIYFSTVATQTLANPIVFNTGLGTDRFGVRSDVAGITLSGQITANSDAVFSSNTITGAFILTNKVSGAGGLVLDLSQTSTASTVLTVTLNSAANANDYQGDTVVGRTNAAPAQTYTARLTLGAANQIPNGAGKGNVILNNNTATRTGNLNMAGFSDTINGLSGNGTVDGTSGSPILTLGDNDATATFSGIVKNTAGTLNVTKIGTGTQTLSGANTHTGGTTLNQGTLTVGTGGTLGANTNPLSVNNNNSTAAGTNAILNLATAVDTTVGSLSGTIATPLSGTNTATINNGGLGRNFTVNQTVPGTYAGVIAGAGSLTLGGTNALTLSGVNTYTGATAINSGALVVAANGALGANTAGTTVAANAALGFSGGINYTATETISGNGSGTTTSPVGPLLIGSRGFIQSVSGSNTFAGNIELNANGTSRIGTQDGASLILTGAITQAAGITTANILFRVGNTDGDFVTLSSASNSFGSDSTVFTGATVGYAGVRLGIDNALPTNLSISGFSGTAAAFTALDLNGFDQTLNGLASGVGGISIINKSASDSILTLNPTANKNTTNHLILGGGGLGVISVVKDGTFTQTLSSANTYTGGTTLSQGTLTVGTGGTLGATTGTLSVNNTNSTGVGTNAVLNLATAVDTTVGSLSGTIATPTSGTNTATINNGGAGRDFTVNQTAAGSYDGVIAGAGSFTLGSLSTNTLTLTGPNTYTGKTTVSAGTLSLSGTGSLADTGAVELTSLTSVFSIAGINASETIATLDGVAGSSVVLGAKTLEIGNGPATYSGNITDAGLGGSVTKSGNGVQTLSGNNTYSGSTNISGGTLLLGSNTALPSGATLSLSGGTLQTGAFGGSTGALSVTAASTIDMNDAASVLTFANTGTWSGLLSVWNYTGGAIWTASTGDKLLFSAGTFPDPTKVQFYSDGGSTLVGLGGDLITSGGGFELVPVPEASTAVGALALLGLVGYRERRRFFHRR